MKRVMKGVVFIAFVIIILVVGQQAGIAFQKIQADSKDQSSSQNKSVNLNGLEKIEGNKKELYIVTKENDGYKLYKKYENITESIKTVEFPDNGCRIIYKIDDKIIAYKDVEDGKKEKAIAFDVEKCSDDLKKKESEIELEYGLRGVAELKYPDKGAKIHTIKSDTDGIIDVYKQSEQSVCLVIKQTGSTAIHIFYTEDGLEKEITRTIKIRKGENPAELVKEQEIYEISNQMPEFLLELKNESTKDVLSLEKENNQIKIESITNKNQTIKEGLVKAESGKIKPVIDNLKRYVENREIVTITGKIEETSCYKEKPFKVNLIYEWAQPEDRNYTIKGNSYNEHYGTYGGEVHITSEDIIYRWEHNEWVKKEEIVLKETGTHKITFRAGENVFRNVVVNIDNDAPDVEVNWEEAAYQIKKEDKTVYYLKYDYKIPLRINNPGEKIKSIILVYKEQETKTYNVKFEQVDEKLYLMEPFDGIHATEEGELHIVDEFNNKKILKTPCIVADSTKPGIFTVNLYENTENGKEYQQGTWTSEDVIIKLNEPTKQPPAGIKEIQHANEDPYLEGIYWVNIKEARHYSGKNMLKITDTVVMSFSFRAVSNTGVIGEPSPPVIVKIQKGGLANAISEVGYLGDNDDENNWHSTVPIIVIKHPTHESFPKDGEELTTHYKLYQITQGERKLLESKRFIRAFKNGGYEADDNIEEPLIRSDGEYYLEIWTSTEREKSEIKSYKIKMDREKPNVPKMFYSEKPEDNFVKMERIIQRKYLFYKGETTVSLEGEDRGPSGIAYYKYQLVPNTERLDWTKWSKTESDRVVVPSGFKGRLFVIAVDYAENESEVAYMFGDEVQEIYMLIVDNNKPKKPTLYSWVDDKKYEVGEWVSSKVIIQAISESPVSGIEKYQYTTVDNAREIDWKELPQSGKGTPRFGGVFGWLKDKISIESDTNITYYFRTISKTGMISDISQVDVRVQVTKPDKPIVSITPEKSNGKGEWYCTVPEIKISHPKRTESNKEAAPFITYYQFYNIEEGQKKESQEIKSFKESEKIKCPVVSKDGTYILKVWTKDVTGNYCETSNGKGYEQYQIQVDSARPGVKIMMNNKEVNSHSGPSSYKLFLRQNTKVKVDCFDQTSGIETIEYQKVAPGASFDENKNWVKANEFNVNKNEAFVAYFRVTDKAGNQNIVSTDGIIMDQQQPEGEGNDKVTIVPHNINEKGISNQDVPVDIVVKDPKYTGTKRNAKGVCSGIKKVSYSILKDGVTLKEKTLFENEKQSVPYEELVKQFKHTVVISADEFEKNHLVVVVNAEDNAGNKTSNECTFSIDKTKPVLTLTYNKDEVKNEKYYNNTRVASLTIREENFNPEKIHVFVKKNNIALDSNNLNMHKEGKEYRGLLMFKEDGFYQVSVSYEDEAGNKADYNRVDEFIIDTKSPEINVNYQDGEGKSGKYYRSSRTAMVEIYEQNYGEPAEISISAMHDGQVMKSPEPKPWSKRGDYYTTSIVYQEDGEYTCNIKITDLAGNEAIYKEETPFFVDCNAPNVIISGVKDCSANSNDVIPIIRVKDTYIDTNSVKVHLVGTKKGEIAKDIKPIIDNGECRFVCDVFKKSKEIDDVYTLTVLARDLSGNETEEEIKFSVNRFGSTYTTDERCANVINQYIKEPSEFIIVETNPDFLKQYFVKCSRNGTVYDLIENEDYRVIKTGTENTWKQYRFIINKENFKEEGFYNISLYSTDIAGNKSDNQSKNQEFKFVVDKTSPTCIITGVKDKESYKDEKRRVYFKLEDNSFIDSVSLEVNDVVVKEFKKEDIEKKNGEFECEILSKESLQDMKLCCVDAAGNKSVETVEEFLITTNPWVQFYNDKVKLYSVIAVMSGVMILCGIYFFIRKRKKHEGIVK